MNMESTRQVQNGKPDSISVLAVDDDRLNLSILDTLLRECGYEVSCVGDGFEALRILESQKFDAMLCDMIMPGMSGPELVEKARELHGNMVVIMMVSSEDVPTVRTALDLGAHDFLVKPFSHLPVPIVIERNLRRAQMEASRVIQQRNKVLVETIKALSAAMDAKEHGTVEHSERIASMAVTIADAISLPATDKSTLELAAYMHDIGKIGVSEAILLKPDKLSETEWQKVKMHPDTGSHILSNLEELSDVSIIIRHHHERVDGKGYPDGLSGEQIPLLSRILAVADAFDAMTSDRPYRPRLTEHEALKQLQEGSGGQFDGRLVEVFLNSMEQDIRKTAA